MHAMPGLGWDIVPRWGVERQAKGRLGLLAGPQCATEGLRGSFRPQSQSLRGPSVAIYDI